MRAARKFLFDTSFDDEEDEAEQPPAEPEIVEEPAITPEDLAAARSEGYAAGHSAGTDEERAATSRMHALAAEQIASRLAEVDAGLQELSETAPRQAVAMALAVVRRILPDYVKREGTREIEALLRGCLRDLIDEPRLVLRVGEGAFDAVNEILTPLTTRAGFSGRVVLLADEDLGGSDCLIEWADGGAQRNLNRTWREIDETVTRILSTPTASERTTDATGDPSPADVTRDEGTGGYNA